MKYEIFENKIVLDKLEDFDIAQILECGQIFRFFKDDCGNYTVYFKDNYAFIYEDNDKIVIETNNVSDCIEFFDFSRDYSKIKKELSVHEVLVNPIENGKGIRILKGDAEEIIFSFIISANNNIKRIQKIIEKLSEIGEDKGEYRAFPKAEAILNASDEFMASLHAGYRTAYLKKTAEILVNTDLKEKAKLSTPELKKWLLSLSGVGPKVASCILLFGFNRFDTFPVDTWIEKVYKNHFYCGEKSRVEIEKYFIELFGENNAGIVQQYLFYDARQH